jgi:hypothetical protein
MSKAGLLASLGAAGAIAATAWCIGHASLRLDGLFRYHPACLMTWFALMTVSLLVAGQRRGKGMSGRQFVGACHAILLNVGLASGAVGLYYIYQNKEMAGKPHLTSYHAWAGVAAVALELVAHTIAVVRTAAPSKASKSFPNLVWRSFYHKSAGWLAHSAMLAAVILGLRSGWSVGTFSESELRILYGGIVTAVSIAWIQGDPGSILFSSQKSGKDGKATQ